MTPKVLAYHLQGLHVPQVGNHWSTPMRGFTLLLVPYHMVFLHCMEPAVIQLWDIQLNVDSEPHQQMCSITRKTLL